MNRTMSWIALAGLLPLLGACEVVDRVRGNPAGETTTEGGVTFNLESPGMVRAGEEAAFRISVWNRADTVVHAVRAELFLPAWMEPLPPQPEGLSVTMVSSGEGTRLSYAIAEPALQPGESRTVVQRVRTPTQDWAGADISPSRTVRAWLVGPGGHPLGGEVSSDVRVEGLAAAGSGGEAAAGSGAVDGRGIGPVRLGMSADELRRAVPNARDTTWSAEGMTERGMVVPLPDGGAATARLEDGRVGMIRIADRSARTAEGVGVGSTLDELRAAYGEPCAAPGEGGETVVWFARKPGLSWVLDGAPPRPAAQRRDPSQLPGSATVRAMLVRQGAEGC